jgi:hypothetical protein
MSGLAFSGALAVQSNSVISCATVSLPLDQSFGSRYLPFASRYSSPWRRSSTSNLIGSAFCISLPPLELIRIEHFGSG